ncbi:glucosyltransferase [Thelephora terrestris]|uniref:Alpha-1,3-glucosyltransferase n=1 Tax=Thelephora terrestris TaxID=56493 RepID=A0A9P6L2M7_9AGAM|nr:glucosyltransferase [Thelephora terrestris]
MHKDGVKRWILPCVLLSTTWVKWATGLGSYSGRDTPPMFGDYEAQRHWMEITTHLPFQQWYTYDLQYWGLDYPPLTAYHSWLCGKVGSWIEPSWFALDASRGMETDGSKVYMRATVLICDLLYVWAVFTFTRATQPTRSIRTQNLTMVILLTQPALLLIDFGHFQYNSVMLALTLLSVNYMSKGQDVIAAVFFVASLGFKQMALYYAPAIGSYLLAKCIYLGQKNGGKLFVQLGVMTVASFILLFLPFLPPFASPTAILDPVTRIFPFSRGLFEDKVANFWCFSNVVLKWRNLAGPGTLVKISTLLTAVGFLPAVVGLLRTGYSSRIKDDVIEERNETPTTGPGPLFPLLLFSMLTSSMSFFLFSFQVHEKTILVPLLPLTLIMVGASGSVESTTWELGMLTNNVAVFSMWPLLKRDGLGVQYFALTVLWNAALGYTPFRRPRTYCQFLSLVVSVACIALHLLEFFIQPPARYPDLFPVLNVLVSTPVFGLVWLWSIKSGVEVGWAIAGLGGLGLNLGLGEHPSDRLRNRVQSLGVSSVRKRAPNFPEGLPPLSD